VTVAVGRSLRVVGRFLSDDIRIGRVAVTLAVSIGLLRLALHVPPFVTPGADLAAGGQRDYAGNIWQDTQTSLALVALVLPWLVYGLLWQGAAWGRRILLAVATAGVVLTTWLALLSAQSYAALLRQVTGIVDVLQGRTISLRGGGRYYLVLPDAELRSAQSWMQPGTTINIWCHHAGRPARSALPKTQARRTWPEFGGSGCTPAPSANGHRW